MLIITAGSKYTDIDVYACAIAYQELMQKVGRECKVILPGKLNHSISKKLLDLPVNFKTQYKLNLDDTFCLVDVSDPSYFADFVEHKKIEILFDHHFGFESYWAEKLQDKSIVQPIGACATLIWEEFVKHNLDNKISETSSNLLSAAIISNTLNLKASICCDRDINAFKELQKYISLDHDWIQKYFLEQQNFVLSNIETSLENDTKIIQFKSINKSFSITQIELWNSNILFTEFLNQVTTFSKKLQTTSDYWFITSPSIEEGVNYIYCQNKELKELLTSELNALFNGDIGKTTKVWLRKEILKKLQKL